MPSFNDGLTEGLSIGTLLYLLVEWLCRQWKRKEEGDQNCSYQVQQSIAFIYTFSECSTAVCWNRDAVAGRSCRRILVWFSSPGGGESLNCLHFSSRVQLPVLGLPCCLLSLDGLSLQSRRLLVDYRDRWCCQSLFIYNEIHTFWPMPVKLRSRYFKETLSRRQSQAS